MLSSPPENIQPEFRKSKGLFALLKNWISRKLKMLDYPFISAHRSFGSPEGIVISGHVFRSITIRQARENYTWISNSIELLKRFLLKPAVHAEVAIHIGNRNIETKTDSNGFFSEKIKDINLSNQWHSYQVELKSRLVEGQEKVSAEGELYFNSNPSSIIISDIDDTFMISHSTSILKKLYLLLTKNSETRKAFEYSPRLYSELAGKSNENPIFYVSSSEWNLYDFIIDFCEKNQMPKGVYLLQDLKSGLRDLLKSGQGNHNHKKDKIRLIASTYGKADMILIGDNGQKDPWIYHSIAKEYSGRVKKVFIRNVRKSNAEKVLKLREDIRENGGDLVQFTEGRELLDLL